LNTHADKTQETKSQSVANGNIEIKRSDESTYQFVDIRPEATAQRKLQEMGNNTPQVSQLRAFQEMANNSPQVKQMAQLQAIANNHSAQKQQPIQKKENNTGLPDALKSGIENLSGMSMGDVKVHYNSDKPAQLQAHAYAQGTDIHLASGQEKHLPHEAWHVVQQKQGRVKPTMQMKGKVNVNDDAGLEKEADVMGAKAENIKFNTSEQLPFSLKKNTINNPVRQNKLFIAETEITEALLTSKLSEDKVLKSEEKEEVKEVISFWIVVGDKNFTTWEDAIKEAKVNLAFDTAENREYKLQLSIPTGFPGLNAKVTVIYEEEETAKNQEWKFEVKGGAELDVWGLLKLGVEIALELKVSIENKVKKGMTWMDAAEMVIKDFNMRERMEDIDELGKIATEAIPEIQDATVKANKMVDEALAKFKIDSSAENVNKEFEKSITGFGAYCDPSLMDNLVKFEESIKNYVKVALELLGCNKQFTLKSLSAKRIEHLIKDMLVNAQPGADKRLRETWDHELIKETGDLIKVFTALKPSNESFEKSSIAYSAQGMINAYAQIGDLDSTGGKMTVGAGLKASRNPDDNKKTAVEGVMMAKGELNVGAAKGELIAKLNHPLNGPNYWEAELEVEIKKIIPSGINSTILLLRLTKTLLPLITTEAKKEENQEGKEKGESLWKKSKEFIKEANRVGYDSFKDIGIKGSENRDLILFFSIKEVIIDKGGTKKSTFEVELEVGEGSEVKQSVPGGQEVEYSTKNKLKVKK
jgi:hypothetical protein